MDRGNDLRAVRRQSSVLVIVLEINRELVHAESFEFFNTAHLLRWRTDDAETVNDLIGDEIGVESGIRPCSLRRLVYCSSRNSLSSSVHIFLFRCRYYLFI